MTNWVCLFVAQLNYSVEHYQPPVNGAHTYYGHGGPSGDHMMMRTPNEIEFSHAGSSELDNFSSLGTLRPQHSTDPYFDTKLMKQKLLSVNVPESCV